MKEFRFTDPACLTEEHRMLREQIRRFVEKEVMPQGDAWEEAGMIPREVFRRMGSLGFLGIRHDPAYGGAGLGPIASLILAEEIGRSTYGGFNISVLVHTDMSSTHIGRRGTEAQKRKYLPPIISGEKVCCIAVTEPWAGSDVAGLKTRARRDGDDWVIDGSKTFITNGVHADIYIIAARTDPEAKGSRGISLFIVEKGTPGLKVVRKLEKQGWFSSDTAELAFDEMRVPAASLLGEENRGFYAIMDNFQNERLVIGGVCAGESAKALELTLDYVRTREAFGGTLWDLQATRQRLALLASKLAAVRQLTFHAAELEERGADTVLEVSMIKALAPEIQHETMHGCLQLHGGTGWMRGTPIERMTRDSRVLMIGGGATEVMLEEVAKRL